MEIIRGNILRGHLETMVLSVVRRKEAHGYEILQNLEQQGSGALKLKEGTLYPVLYRLEAAGLLWARWEADVARRRGPRRRIYRITEKGRRTLRQARKEWRQFVTIVGAIVEGP